MKVENSSKAKKTFKGTVLFTVLITMTLIIILMITAIGLASAASDRAYRDYFDHQTQSTARSLVDSVVLSMKDDNKELGEAIVKELQNAAVGKTVDVQVNSASGGFVNDGFGTVDKLVFEKVGTDKDGSSADGYYNITGSGKPIIKITATVTQGGVATTHSQYVIGKSVEDNKTSTGGGFIALGGFDGVDQPGVDTNAPAYFGIKEPKEVDYATKLQLSNPNNGELSSILENSSVTTKTQIKSHLGKGEGFIVMGNLYTDAGQLMIYTDYTGDSYNSSPFNDIQSIPYLYVGGALNPSMPIEAGSNGGFKWNGTAWGTEKENTSAPINIYCGRYVTNINQGAVMGNANIYCYNSGTEEFSTSVFNNTDGETFAKSSWSRMGTSTNTMLLEWTKKNVGGASTLETGSLYTLGNLLLENKFDISGDVYVKGVLRLGNIDQNSKIKGTLYVDGDIQDASGNSISDSAAKDILKKGETSMVGNLVYKGEVSNSIKEFKNKDGKLGIDTIEKMVKTPQKAHDQFYDADGFKNAVNKSLAEIKDGFEIYDWNNNTLRKRVMKTNEEGKVILEDATVKLDNDKFNYIYSSSGKIDGAGQEVKTKTVEINNSCAISGEISGITFYFNPSKEMWVNLNNVKFSNNCNFIVNDAYKVHFYLPCTIGTNDYSEYGIGDAEHMKLYVDSVTSDTKNALNFASASVIATKNYYDKVINPAKTETIDLVDFPQSTATTEDDWMLPKLEFASSETGKVSLTFPNNIFITGDICCPNAELTMECKAIRFGDNSKHVDLTYKGRSLPNGMTASIGSIIVDRIVKFNNDFSICYVDNPADADDTVTGDKIYEWDPLSGFANF